MIQFKTRNEEEEYYSGKLDIALVKYLHECACFVFTNFGKDIVITEVWRSPEEQAEICKRVGKQYRSKHEFWDAVDLRSWIYNKEERRKLFDYMLELERHYLIRHIFHRIPGGAWHFHVEIT